MFKDNYLSKYNQICPNKQLVSNTFHNTKAHKPFRPLRKKRAIFIVALIAVIITTAFSVYAVTGGLDMFRSHFGSPFEDLAVAPAIPAYYEAQGIRIEVVGAQQIGNVALVYLTMQDVSGENRLSTDTRPDVFLSLDGQAMNGPARSRRLYFNRDSNTLYFEYRIVGDIGISRADTMTLGVRNIAYFPRAGGQVQAFLEGDWQVTVDIGELEEQIISWSDISADNIQLNHMILTPLGVEIQGSINSDKPESLCDFQFGEIEIELENQWRNIRLQHSSGGGNTQSFMFYFHADSPIDIEQVTAVRFNGIRAIPPA